MTARDAARSAKAYYAAHPARTIVTAVASLILLWVAGTVMLGALARVDAVCTSCHAMRPYAEAAPSSPHSGLECTACHSEQGASALVTDGLAMQRRMGAAVIGRAPAAVSPLDERQCRACHEPMLGLTVNANGIAVRHSDFSEAECSECHAGTGHRLTERTYSATAMDDCLACHRTSAINVSGCELCHVDGDRSPDSGTQTAWGVVHGETWTTTHGAGDLEKCRSCHPRDYCTECHGTPIPHGTPWARDHGASVLADGGQECGVCHESGWCDRCHGVPMPHASDFLSTHPEKAANIADPACTRCHDALSCEICHYQSAHPDVPGVGFSHEESGR